MVRHHTHRLWLLLYSLVAALVLTGCGGGGGGGSSTPAEPENTSTVSGTAAAGAPLVGFVGARDINDETAPPADINADGSFEIDLSSLDAPVLLYASGIAGGNAYQLLSVVFADDLDGTVNITPLTDLIVGNAVGQPPQTFFNNPDFSLIREAEVEAQKAALKARLQPLLDELDVEPDFDLLKSAFTANRTGFDTVLDVLDVQIDLGTEKATITNRLNRTQSIENTFMQPEEGELAVDENEISNGVSELQKLDALANSFATALDNQDGTALEALATADYLNNGEDITGLQDRLFGSVPGTEDAGELAEDIRNWSIVELGEGTAKLNIGAPQGPWNVVNVDGNWKVQGNQLEFFVFVEPTHLIENGAETPEVLNVGTLIYAGFPAPSLGAATDSSVDVSGDLSIFNGPLPYVAEEDRFAEYEVLNPDAIASGDTLTFT